MKSTVGKAAEKRENYGVKLSKVGKSGVQSTPVASFLTPNKESKPFSAAPPHDYGHNTSSIVGSQELRALKENPFRVVSARKLAALVWELHQYKLPLSGMYHGGGTALPRLRRHGLHPKGDVEVHYPKPSTPEMPESSSNLRRRVPASPTMEHNRPTERFNNAIQPISPASYGSSMEIAPYNPAVTPSSSVELRGRTGEANLSLRTSTELLKVLNRIWSLEEQHVSNVALVKALKKELDRSRAQIKILVREQQNDRQEINELMKQISEDKLARKNKEQHDRAEAAVNSMREELGNERKLRRRSESLHRKLAHELHDVKVILGNVSKDLENERKSRLLLEDLCDEFAVGISKYGKELRSLRQDSDRDWADSSNYDRLTLDISESWLDERMQMKLDLGHGFEGNKSAVIKLSSEIEAFLKAKTSISAANNNGNYKLTRESLESIPLNTAISAPQGEDDDDDDDKEDDGEDSAYSDSNCFELEKMGEALIKSQGKSYHDDETTKQNKPVMKKRIGSSDKATTGLSPSRLQVKFEEQMARAISHLEKSNQVKDEAEQSLTTEQAAADLIESIPLRNREKGVVLKEESAHEREGNDMIENLNRNHYMLVQSEKLQPENKDYGGAASSSSHWKSQPSPVRQWTDKFPSHGMSESSSSKLPQELKENTLKAKLLEARTRGQTSRSRLKSSRNV